MPQSHDARRGLDLHFGKFLGVARDLDMMSWRSSAAGPHSVYGNKLHNLCSKSGALGAH